MRFVDTSRLECLGAEGGGPWRLGEDELLRTSWMDAPILTLEQAQGVFDAYHSALGKGVPVPEPREVVLVPDGYGVVVEYLPGLGIGAHVMFGSYTLEEGGRALGALARAFHEAQAFAGLDWRARFQDYARILAPYLPASVADRLLSLVDALPESHTLLHGDLHPGNVIVCDGEFAVIDLETAGFGHPVLDLAIMRSRVFTGPEGWGAVAAGEQVQRASLLWREVLGEYFQGREAAEIEDVDRRIEVLAEVEGSLHDYGLLAPAEGVPRRLTPAQKARIDACALRLEHLFSQVDQLSF